MPPFKAYKDITESDARPLHEVNPSLVVLKVDHSKPIMLTHALKASRSAIAANAEEMAKKGLSLNLIANLFQKTGWTKGVRMPFATKENIELEKILEARQRRYLVVQSEFTDNEEHVKMLQESFARANEDIQTRENFLASKRKLTEEERNLLALAERVISKVRQESQIIDKQLKDIRDRCGRVQCTHDRRVKNLSELRDMIEFDRVALKEYHDRLTKYQNQKLEIGRIIQEDSKLVEDYDKQYVELGAQRKALRIELDMQAMTTAKCQEQLDRLSVEFRKVYRSRQEMIMLWSSNIESAKRKDAQMHEAANGFIQIRTKIRELSSEMDYRERQYKFTQCGIRNGKLKITELDKKLSDGRRAMQNNRELVGHLKDSILEIQADIRANSVEEKAMHAKFHQLDSEMGGLQGKFDRIRAVVDKLKSKLSEVSSLRYNSDQNINVLEKLYEDEVKKSDTILREMELTRKYYWERSNDKKEVARDLVHLDTDIQRLKTSLSNFETKQFFNLEFLAKQSAKIYRLDLESSKMDNKLNRVEIDTVNPHLYTHQTELTEQKDTLRQIEAEKKYISKELGFLKHLIVKSGVELAKSRDEKDKLSTELLQINMVSQRTQKLIDKTSRHFQDLQVENSLELVNLKRLTDSMRLAKEQLYSLEEERRTMQGVVQERKLEIENCHVLNLNKSKALVEAINKVKVQIQEMANRTEKMKGRFDLVTRLMTSTKGGEGDDENIGDRVRRTARERETLQLELRKWESRVKEAQRELTGLQNVNKVIVASNLSVKEKLTPIQEGSTESQDLQVLEEEEKAIHVRKNRALHFKDVLFDKIEDLKQQLAVMEQESQATAHRCELKLVMLGKIDSEKKKQQQKVGRWTSLCAKILNEVRNTIQDPEIVQKDLCLRFLHEKLDCAFTMLERLIHAFPSHKVWIIDYLEKDKHLLSMKFRLLKPGTGRSVSSGRADKHSPVLKASSRSNTNSHSPSRPTTPPGKNPDKTGSSRTSTTPDYYYGSGSNPSGAQLSTGTGTGTGSPGTGTGTNNTEGVQSGSQPSVVSPSLNDDLRVLP